MPTLSTIEVHPDREPVASVIWRHGLGANGHDFAPAVPALDLPADLPVRFVFPNAPSIPVTLNGGFVMPAWYDIESLDKRGHDEEGVLRSSERVGELIQREVGRGIETSRVVLAGFSMGAAMALHVGLRYPERLAGLIALSGYVVRGDSLAAEASDANRDTPVLVCHGTEDPMVPVALGQSARDRLKELGHDVEWHDYPIEHSASIEELRDVGAWLRRLLG